MDGDVAASVAADSCAFVATTAAACCHFHCRLLAQAATPSSPLLVGLVMWLELYGATGCCCRCCCWYYCFCCCCCSRFGNLFLFARSLSYIYIFIYTHTTIEKESPRCVIWLTDVAEWFDYGHQLHLYIVSNAVIYIYVHKYVFKSIYSKSKGLIQCLIQRVHW